MEDAAAKTQDNGLGPLISAVESSLADMVAALGNSTVANRIAGVEKLLSAIEAGIADIASAAGQQMDLGPLVDAIKAVKPTINVNVPAITVPAPVVHIMPAAPAPQADMKGATWSVLIPGVGGQPDRSMKITRTS